MATEWTGEERRKEMQNLTVNLATLTERVGNLINTLETHISTTDQRLSSLEFKVYVGIGLVVALDAGLKFIKI